MFDASEKTDQTTTCLIEAQSLRRTSSRDGVTLLDNVSLRLCAGDRVVLRGPTGSGKTVLLRALSLLDACDAGDLLWHGRLISSHEIPRYRSRVVYLHQRPVIFEGSVRENLQRPFSLAIHAGRKFNEALAEQQIAVCGLNRSFLDRQGSKLSGGEAQIVALIRALQLEPEVLLLDEPTASLDAKTANLVERLVMDWQSALPKNRAFIWITHAEQSLVSLANRMWQMRSGQCTSAATALDQAR